MSHAKHLIILAFAVTGTLSMYATSAAVIDSDQPFVSTFGSTHTDIVEGGSVSFFDAYDTSSVAMSGGHVSFLALHDSASAVVSDGDVSWLQVYDTSSATITGAHDLSWLVVGENAHVDIYATNTSFSNGILSGLWEDGTAFEFWAVLGALSTPITITEALPTNISILSRTAVPEPATTLLFTCSLAGLVISRRKRAEPSLS